MTIASKNISYGKFIGNSLILISNSIDSVIYRTPSSVDWFFEREFGHHYYQWWQKGAIRVEKLRSFFFKFNGLENSNCSTRYKSVTNSKMWYLAIQILETIFNEILMVVTNYKHFQNEKIVKYRVGNNSQKSQMVSKIVTISKIIYLASIE